MTDISSPQPVPEKLWLWKNFVDGRPEYWAFDNPFPVHLDCGDPQTLGEPCGYALFKPSRTGRTDVPEAEVIRRIKAAIPAPEGAQLLTNDQLWASWLCCPPAAEGDDDSMEARVVKFGRAVEQRVRAALAAPAPHAPVALTDEQLTQILASHAGPTIRPYQIARAVEAAHGIPAPQTKEHQ